MHPAQRAVGRQSRRLTPLPHSYPQIPPSRTLAACGPAPALLDAAHLTKGKADMRRLMVMALPLLLAIPVAAQEQDADDSTEIGSGMASYYGDRFAGNRTASGERFEDRKSTRLNSRN